MFDYTIYSSVEVSVQSMNNSVLLRFFVYQVFKLSILNESAEAATVAGLRRLIDCCKNMLA